MTVAMKNGKDVMQVVRTAVVQHGATRDELIPILTDVNRELGYIPHEAVDEVSRLIGMPKSQLYSVASFYDMLSLKPARPARDQVLRECAVPRGGRAAGVANPARSN